MKKASASLQGQDFDYPKIPTNPKGAPGFELGTSSCVVKCSTTFDFSKIHQSQRWKNGDHFFWRFCLHPQKRNQFDKKLIITALFWSWEFDISKVCNSTGGTWIWTRDLLICSQMLYHWAIPPINSIKKQNKINYILHWKKHQLPFKVRILIIPKFQPIQKGHQDLNWGPLHV